MAVSSDAREMAYEHLCLLEERLGARRDVFEHMRLMFNLDPDQRLRAFDIARRRLAMQLLYQFDSPGRGATQQQDVLRALEQVDDLGPVDFQKTADLVLGALRTRQDADKEMERLAPTWPPSRQPAVDRAILRLAYFEMTSGMTPPKVVVNEAVELAKRFSTDKSPAFVNGLLAKVLGQVAAKKKEGAGKG